MARSFRNTISVLKELYAALAKAAEAIHVSTGWGIREALWRHVGDQYKVVAVSSAAGRGRGAKKVKGG